MDTLIHLDPLPSLESSFAVEDHLSEGPSGAVARIWRHRPSLVLGLRDARLPDADAAIAHFRSQGFDVHVRSSGGRLVVLDEGVLNVALGFSGERLPSVDEGFRLMTDLIRDVIRRCGVDPEVGEIPGSICPGRYDVAVRGRKVAGLSQRRRRDYALVHAFLLVEGTGDAREQLAMQFYSIAHAPVADAVLPGTMAALGEFRSETTIALVVDILQGVLTDLTHQPPPVG